MGKFELAQVDEQFITSMVASPSLALVYLNKVTDNKEFNYFLNVTKYILVEYVDSLKLSPVDRYQDNNLKMVSILSDVQHMIMFDYLSALEMIDHVKSELEKEKIKYEQLCYEGANK